jgi:indolepyruvate ferredoxin oxidoreductase, alpha subunit
LTGLTKAWALSPVDSGTIILIENFQNGTVPYPLIKLTQYPLPSKMIEKLVSETEKILVIEDGYPIVEEQLKGLLSIGIKVHGRLDGTLPRDGELNPNILARALGMKIQSGSLFRSIVVGRPPSMCNGCSHIDSYQCVE